MHIALTHATYTFIPKCNFYDFWNARAKVIIKSKKNIKMIFLNYFRYFTDKTKFFRYNTHYYCERIKFDKIDLTLCDISYNFMREMFAASHENNNSNTLSCIELSLSFFFSVFVTVRSSLIRTVAVVAVCRCHAIPQTSNT